MILEQQVPDPMLNKLYKPDFINVAEYEDNLKTNLRGLKLERPRRRVQETLLALRALEQGRRQRPRLCHVNEAR